MHSHTKLTLWLILLFMTNTANANMASPYIDGTKAASAFSSRHVDILHETIRIQIDERFYTAKYIVEYTIKSDVTGQQIPLLFYAVDYKEDFCVWLDDVPVEVLAVPYHETAVVDSCLSDFSQYIEMSENRRYSGVRICWGKYSSLCFLEDLKYFEPELSEGIHKIRVEYVADVWRYFSGWITEYSFHYSLLPARSWRSFGKLDVIVEQAGEIKEYSSNLGSSHEGRVERTNTWHFDSLPDIDFLKLVYKPQPNPHAQKLIFLGPHGLTLIFLCVLFLLHWLACRRYRKQHPQKRPSWVVIVGSFVVPFLSLLFFIHSIDIIGWVIGDDASQQRGYMFLYVFLYPFLMPLYWWLMWLLDRRQKKKLERT